MITIVDYGMGNLGSIQNMLKRLGAKALITSDIKAIGDAEKLILPGVGAFDTAMTRVNNSGLREILDRKALTERVPILGICLGMQLLTRSSEEGRLSGLGWIPATTKRFPNQPNMKIPHMGWNVVSCSTPSLLTAEFEPDTRFYFVHSYYVEVEERAHSILTTRYILEFDSAIQRENIFGVQFHPEKSHRFGMRLLNNFLKV